MPESLSYTTYQQGTYLHHAMAAGKSKRTFEVILHYAIPIKEDPTEAWLADYPLEKRVSKEVAQLATEQVRQMDEQVNARLHIRDLLLARSVFLSETERLAKQLESHQRTFVLELERIIGHRPTADDIETVCGVEEAVQTQALRQMLFDALHSQHEYDRRPAPSTELDSDFGNWAANNPPQSASRAAADKEAKERAEYNRYRDLIRSVEARHLRNSR